MKYRTKSEAAHAFVSEFNAIDQRMIAELMSHNPDDWSEVTLPAVGDRVYVFSENWEGEIRKVLDRTNTYIVKSDSGTEFEVSGDDIEVQYDDVLPMWGTMWSFGDACDEHWIEEEDGVEVMSRLGFRIYYHEEYGYFFGIDGAGFDFYEAYWIPLYNARGLKWHEE